MTLPKPRVLPSRSTIVVPTERYSGRYRNRNLGGGGAPWIEFRVDLTKQFPGLRNSLPLALLRNTTTKQQMTVVISFPPAKQTLNNKYPWRGSTCCCCCQKRSTERHEKIAVVNRNCFFLNHTCTRRVLRT